MQPTPYETLMAAFLDTPEMEDWNAFVAAARQGIAAGGETVALPAAFLKRVIDDIATGPLNFQPYKDLWNRLCDEQGRPEFKTGQEGTETGQEGPF